MKWSFTASKIFAQCQRKWYYSEIMASHGKRDPLRKEAYLLKQLQSLYAWRGSLVDNVIEKLIVPGIRHNGIPSEGEVIDYSMQLMEKRLDFGKAKKYRLPDVTKSNAGDAYCAFYDLEYNGCLDEKELELAKEEVKISLKNLLRSGFLKNLIQNNSYIVAQRKLAFQFADANIQCTPDLIVFFKNEPPLIVDWKVHSFANIDYWLQLGIYGVALSRTNPHKDFPEYAWQHLEDPTNIRLVEYQLLKNHLREYAITPEDIVDIEDYIFSSVSQMSRITKGKNYDKLDSHEFQTARWPDICIRCKFKKICCKKSWFT